MVNRHPMLTCPMHPFLIERMMTTSLSPDTQLMLQLPGQRTLGPSLPNILMSGMQEINTWPLLTRLPRTQVEGID